jgi:hypothetical protein
LGTGLVNQAFQGLTNSIFGGAGNGLGGPGGTNYKMFPGGGISGESKADYGGGSAYTLTDVVFNLRPANRGPQQSGLEQATNDPKSITSIPANQFTKTPFNVKNYTAKAIKGVAMNRAGGLLPTSFAPTAAPLPASTSRFR